jgi:hypothetical protein
MGSKRDYDALAGDDTDESPSSSSKRRRDQQHARQTSKPKPGEGKPDPTYGQRAAFPGLDGPAHLSDDDLEFEEDGDALAYLRAVR